MCPVSLQAIAPVQTAGVVQCSFDDGDAMRLQHEMANFGEVAWFPHQPPQLALGYEGNLKQLPLPSPVPTASVHQVSVNQASAANMTTTVPAIENAPAIKEHTSKSNPRKAATLHIHGKALRELGAMCMEEVLIPTYHSTRISPSLNPAPTMLCLCRTTRTMLGTSRGMFSHSWILRTCSWCPPIQSRKELLGDSGRRLCERCALAWETKAFIGLQSAKCLHESLLIIAASHEGGRDGSNTA